MKFLNRTRDALAEQAADEVAQRREAGEIVFVSKVARAYGVDRQRVAQRLKGIGGRTSRKPVNYKLSAVQEAALIEYIYTLDGIGIGVRPEQLVTTANSILREDHTGDGIPPVVSQRWSHRFFKRHLVLNIMKQKPIELARKAAHDPVLITDWFSRFKAL
jgi:Tc5 transposase DNA-binding domain